MIASLLVITVPTVGGHVAKYMVRPDTNDSSLVGGIVGENEYPFDRMQNLSGWAIDIGAHIGIVTVALALDNPDLRIIAVEALAENVVLLAENIALNGLGDRVTIEAAAAGDGTDQLITYGYRSVPNEPDAYVRDGRYIGGMYSPREGMDADSRMVRGISLSILMEDMDRVALLKLDCEGCEWPVLANHAIERVDRIVGEFHGEPGLGGVMKLLEETHTVTQLDDNPVNGIFWAERNNYWVVDEAPNFLMDHK